MPGPTDARTSWLLFAVGLAVFAAVTAVLGKVGRGEVSRTRPRSSGRS